MKVYLDKQFILRLYCYTFQAERSIAFALGAEWSELREYYAGERAEGARAFFNELQQFVSTNGFFFPGQTLREVERTVRPVGLFRYFFGKWLARCKQGWFFSGRYLYYAAANLSSFLDLLSSPTRPEQQTLVALRMALCSSRSLIEMRCHGWEELARAMQVEHFWKAPWQRALRLTDIVGSHASSTSSARKSA